MRRTSDRHHEQALAILWSAWTEMGVAGWRGKPFSLAIDPEALVLWTGCLGDADPRLRDEALDWCTRYMRLLSRSRIQRLLEIWPVSESWASFAATLAADTKQDWPGAGKPWKYTPTGKSELRADSHAAVLALRIRGLFGTTARAELLRILLLGQPNRRWSITELATEACYTKRNISEALESLRIGSVVDAMREANSLRYRLRRRSELESLCGPVPDDRASFLWRALVACQVSKHIDDISGASDIVSKVESTKFFNALAPNIARAGWSNDAARVAPTAESATDWLTEKLAAFD